MAEEIKTGDKVLKFYNGKYESGICLVVEADENGYGIIPTDCTINGIVPTKENTKAERYDTKGEAFLMGFGRVSIHKATPELIEKTGQYNTRMFLVDKICEELKIGDRNIKATRNVLLTRTVKQLFAIYLILFDKADGTHGICSINKNGKLENDFFVHEELVNEVREPEMKR